MRTVLYTYDMEPITVLELPWWAEYYLSEHKVVRLPVMRPVELLEPNQEPCCDACRVVTIRAERLAYRGRQYMLLFTADEESALLLKCAFLPGQQAKLQEREREAFSKGFLSALARLGKL